MHPKYGNGVQRISSDESDYHRCRDGRFVLFCVQMAETIWSLPWIAVGGLGCAVSILLP
jgi:hypothetical protein